MTRRILILVLLLALAPPVGSAPTSGITEITREVVLSNGMKLLMIHRPGQPSIAAGWVAHVGSANERPGITGISHLFEHMMFKGSPNIGTRDAALDDRLRAELDQVREAMFREERAYRQQVRLGVAESIEDPAIQTERMLELRKRFDALIAEQRENLVKDEFDRIYTEAGATDMNAFTNTDMTVYYIRVPSNKLELWFWMESERLLRPVFREFYSERDVVFEERRMRTESTPTGANDEAFNALFWRGHPYGWPVVGWPSDIGAITRAQAEAYFDLYYAPGNITLALVGDFDLDQAVVLAERYFERIPAGRETPPDVITLSTPLPGEFTYRAEVDAPPSASIEWRTTAYNGVDDPALQVLSSVLSGKTGRLYKRLVLEEQVATGAGASSDNNKYDGSFSVSASGKQGVSPQRLAELLMEEVVRIREEGITEYELTKVKNKLAAAKFRRLENPFFLMFQLLVFDGLGDWRSMDRYFERIVSVTADEVQAAAAKHLTDTGRAIRLYDRKAGDTDPALLALTPEQQAQAAQILQQLAAIPATQLDSVIAEIEGQMVAAPDSEGALMAYVLAQLKARKGGEE